jgi:hypothetical protein
MKKPASGLSQRLLGEADHRTQKGDYHDQQTSIAHEEHAHGVESAPDEASVGHDFPI